MENLRSDKNTAFCWDSPDGVYLSFINVTSKATDDVTPPFLVHCNRRWCFPLKTETARPHSLSMIYAFFTSPRDNWCL